MAKKLFPFVAEGRNQKAYLMVEQVSDTDRRKLTFTVHDETNPKDAVPDSRYDGTVKTNPNGDSDSTDFEVKNRCAKSVSMLIFSLKLFQLPLEN